MPRSCGGDRRSYTDPAAAELSAASRRWRSAAGIEEDGLLAAGIEGRISGGTGLARERGEGMGPKRGEEGTQ
jgi:hypothetical protein